MTVQCYIHSSAKRAEIVALLDSGATENFMNLTYARWLKLPIKRLKQSRKLFNVDRTENASGELKFYTDLQTRTGGSTTILRFFLSDLGEHKMILGYPWFVAVQPKIDWKQGWIDHTQLPIVLKAENAKKATFVPRMHNVPCTVQKEQYYMGCVTVHPAETKLENIEALSEEYQQHKKVFSEEQSQ